MSRTILVTGASGNLGKDVVRHLATEGHQVIALTGSHKVSKELDKIISFQIPVDLGNQSESAKTIENIIRLYPQLDAAVLLAGGFEMGNIKDTDESLLDKQITLNFKTAWFVIQPLLTHFKELGRGQFILMGAKPAINLSESVNKVAYALSKSLVVSLAEIINAEGKDAGITASVIVPEVIDTPQNRKDMPDADFARWVKTSTISDIITFILSDAGRWLRQPVYKAYNRKVSSE
ncbi:MAG: SDR family NAD(P)-dependent oxidoreductase [Saprospiraceae bacterium]